MLYLHIVTAIIGELIFVIAFCAACLYLRNYQKLKHKIINSHFHPTSLSTLENFIVRSSVVGLLFITTSLIFGFIFLFFDTTTDQISIVKILWAFCVWGWYLLAIFGRHLWGWKGKKGAQLILFGMILLIFGLFGTVWPKF